jgi:hypothetical protein
MQYIKTKYLGPTNHKGSRYKATASGAGISVIVGVDHKLGSFENHQAAAKELLKKLDWGADRYCAGGGEDHYVFVPDYEHASFEVTS